MRLCWRRRSWVCTALGFGFVGVASMQARCINGGFGGIRLRVSGFGFWVSFFGYASMFVDGVLVLRAFGTKKVLSKIWRWQTLSGGIPVTFDWRKHG